MPEQPLTTGTSLEEANTLLQDLEGILERFEGCDHLECRHPLCNAIDLIDTAATQLGIDLGAPRC